MTRETLSLDDAQLVRPPNQEDEGTGTPSYSSKHALVPTRWSRVVSAGRSTWLEGIRSSLPLVAADVFAMTVGIGSGRVLVDTFGGAHPAGAAHVAAFAVLVVSIHSFASLYPGTALSPVDELRRGAAGVSCAYGGMVLWLAWRGAAHIVDLFAVGLATLVSIAAFALLRPAVREFAARMSWWGQSAVIFSPGSPQAAESLVAALRDHPEHCLVPVGVVDKVGALPPRFASWSIEIVDSADHRGPDLFSDSWTAPHQLIVHRRWATEFQHWKPILRTIGLPGLRRTNKLLTLRAALIKRAADIFVSFTLLVALAPLLLFVAILIKLSSPGPVFFGHVRIGRGHRRFKAWKFRSMVPDAQARLQQYLSANPEAAREWADTQKLADDPRVTRVGNCLRKTSLDELPQLLNVLMGDMSLVGPRPIITDEVERYGDLFLSYVQVRPGITGLWQVSGRNNTTYAQRVELDGFYIRNWSPWLDLLILFRTLRVVLNRDGAC